MESMHLETSRSYDKTVNYSRRNILQRICAGHYRAPRITGRTFSNQLSASHENRKVRETGMTAYTSLSGSRFRLWKTTLSDREEGRARTKEAGREEKGKDHRVITLHSRLRCRDILLRERERGGEKDHIPIPER